MPWWVWTLKNGRLIIDGSFDTEEDANTRGIQVFHGDFKVSYTQTRDRRLATQAIKHDLLTMTKDLDQAIKRARHIPESPPNYNQEVL